MATEGTVTNMSSSSSDDATTTPTVTTVSPMTTMTSEDNTSSVSSSQPSPERGGSTNHHHHHSASNSNKSNNNGVVNHTLTMQHPYFAPVYPQQPMMMTTEATIPTTPGPAALTTTVYSPPNYHQASVLWPMSPLFFLRTNIRPQPTASTTPIISSSSRPSCTLHTMAAQATPVCPCSKESSPRCPTCWRRLRRQWRSSNSRVLCRLRRRWFPCQRRCHHNIVLFLHPLLLSTR